MTKVLFGGRTLREPGSAAMLRIGVQPAVNPNATNRAAVMGPSDGGVPGTVYTFSSFSDAMNVLRAGDSLKAISYIFNPSPIYPGASQVDFIRTDATPVQGSVALVDATPTTPKTAFTVTAVDYGIWTNGIQVTLANGTDSTTRVITVKVPSPTIISGVSGVATVTGKLFEDPTATFISSGTRVGDALILPTTTGTGSNKVVTATAVKVYTIASVVSETQVTVNETPTAGADLQWYLVRYSRTQVSPALPAVGGANNVNANLVNWINANCADVLTAALGAADATLAVVTAAANPLLGGVQSPMTNTEITNALTLLRTREVEHLYVARACGDETGELNFASLLTGHLLNDAETPGIAYIGAKADKTVAAAMTYAGAVDSGRAVYCMQTAYDSPLSGLGTEEVPGYLLAAKVAGLAAGLSPQVPLTRKPVSILGIKALPTGVQLDKTTRESLLDAGILHVFQPAGTNTFVINQGLTTLQNNDTEWDTQSGQSTEISLMRITDTILNDIETSAASTFVGSTATLAKPVLEHFVSAYLESKVGTLLQGYQNVTVTQVQDQWQVQFGLVPNYPVNTVLILAAVIA